MCKISIFGINSRREAVLEALQRHGSTEICDITEIDEDISKCETEKEIFRLNSCLAEASHALEILNKYSPKKGSLLSRRPALDEECFGMISEHGTDVPGYINSIILAEKALAENSKKIAEFSARQAMLEPYIRLDVPLNTKGTEYTDIRVVASERKLSEETICHMLDEYGLTSCYFEIFSVEKHQSCIWFIYSREYAEEFENFFRKNNFSPPPFEPPNMTAKEKYCVLEAETEASSSICAKYKKQLTALSAHREEIMLYYDRLFLELERYTALSHIGITENTFAVCGYIPKKQLADLKAELEDKFTVYICTEKITDRAAAPVCFSNNVYAEAVEGITSDYSMPSADDIDPNPVMAGFYYLFFGMMFSDAGYGLLMMLVCGILGFSKVLEAPQRRTFKMFFFCGISTTLWGLLYGSFFGDMIDTVSRVFGSGNASLKPILLNPVEKPLELLIMCVTFGMIHIITAMSIKFYILWRTGSKAAAVFDVGFWISLLLGISALAAGAGFKIPYLAEIGKYTMLLSAIGLILTQGRSSSNIFGKLFGGILSLYDITSYIGDILSYSRLMALGLATGVIASVVNILGSLGGSSTAGLILFICVSVFGHSLNFAINCLGAYVHTNRLQYVEFYQKFYKGGGRKFEPFSMKTKYFRPVKNKKEGM